jgi:hypothetical protein
MEAGKYIIVVSTKEPEEYSEYCLEFYSELDVNFHKVDAAKTF